MLKLTIMCHGEMPYTHAIKRFPRPAFKDTCRKHDKKPGREPGQTYMFTKLLSSFSGNVHAVCPDASGGMSRKPHILHTANFSCLLSA